MKNRKTFLCLLLCLVLLSVFLTGCKSKTDKLYEAIVGEWLLQNPLLGDGATTLTFNADLTCKETLPTDLLGTIKTFEGTYEFDKKGILYLTPSKEGQNMRIYKITFEDKDTMVIAAAVVEDQIYKRQK